MSGPSQYIVMDLSAFGHAVTANQMPVKLDGSVPFSIDAWVNMHGLGAGASIFMQQGVFDFGVSGQYVQCTIAGYPTVLSNPAQNPLTEEEWRYLCVTYSQGAMRIYIDGEFNTYMGIAGAGAATTLPFMIGHWFQGDVRCVRLYNTQLDADTVMANMYGDPDMTTVAAWFDFTQNPPVDLGPSHLPITLEQSATMLTQTPSLYLMGTAYAQPIRDEDVNPGGLQVDPYTVQAWVYIEAMDNPLQAIFVNSDLESDSGMALLLKLNQSGSAFNVVSQRGSTDVANLLTSTRTILPKQWVNIATTYDGTNLTIYIQGTQDVQQPFGPIPSMQLASNLLIGAALSHGRPSGATSVHGYINRVDVWNRCLTAQEIAQYMNEMPAQDAEGISAIYQFESAPARNVITSHPIGLADGAVLSLQNSTSRPGGSEAKAAAVADDFDVMPKELDAEALRKIRASFNFTDFLKANPEFFAQGRSKDLAAVAQRIGANDKASRDKIAAAWTKLEETMRKEPHRIPFVTHHKIGGEYIFLWHKGDESHVMYRASQDLFDDCTVWKAGLVLIIIGGILDLFFGVRIQASDRAIRYILTKVLTNPKVIAFLALGTMVTAADIFSLGRTFYDYGILSDLIKIVLDLGFWALVRIVAKTILKFLVVGAAAAEVIASLVATVALFVAAYLQKPQSCTPPPTVSLSGIKFNHNTGSSSTCALNVRRNYTKTITTPEWDPTKTQPQDAPAAYAIQETTGNTITIQASFAIGTKDTIQMQVQATGGGVLGAIDPVTVTFKGGVSTPQFVSLPLNHQTIAATGVSRQDITWTWQFKPASGGSWTTIQTTRHRIYTVLKVPPAPWTQAGYPSNTQLPWTDALDHACQWASASTTADAAAAAVTTKVNQNIGLTYDMSRGASVYTQMDYSIGQSVFLCTDFVSYLGGGTGKGNVINCTDCATIVATFANIVGCELNESVMGYQFGLNEIIAIGYSSFGYPGFGPGFSYHEVAWTATNSYTSPLYDACLQVDSSNYPWTWPGSGHTPEYVLKMVFTTMGISPSLPIATPFSAASYRERLCANTSNGIGKCVPQGPWPESNAGRRSVQ